MSKILFKNSWLNEVWLIHVKYWNSKFLLVDMCVGESSAHFRREIWREGETNDTDHVQDIENQNEIVFVDF